MYERANNIKMRKIETKYNYWVGQKFIWVFPGHHAEKSKGTFWPTQYKT